MNNKLVKTLSFAVLSTSLAFSATAFAEKKNATKSAENIDVTQQQVTKEELSTIFVLSEICPSLVKTDDAYKKGYDNLLKDYLPNEKNPQNALKSLVKQADFKSPLAQARQDAKKASKKENTEICEDVKNYQS
jgi:hypothetical protein